MKPLTTLLTAILLSAISLTACSGTENGMSIQQQTEQRFKLNPNPKQAYRIKIKINDAPGPLKPMNNNYIRYMARNCSYLITSRVVGATTEPTKYIDIPIRQTGHDEYEIVFYFDAVLDEDYFGKGICHWKPDGFGGTFKATGKAEETAFSISDVMEDLINQKTLTKYYRKTGYPYYKNDDGSPYNAKEGIVTSGRPSIDDYSKELQKDLFSITLTIEELSS